MNPPSLASFCVHDTRISWGKTRYFLTIFMLTGVDSCIIATNTLSSTACLKVPVMTGCEKYFKN